MAYSISHLSISALNQLAYILHFILASWLAWSSISAASSPPTLHYHLPIWVHIIMENVPQIINKNAYCCILPTVQPDRADNLRVECVCVCVYMYYSRYLRTNQNNDCLILLSVGGTSFHALDYYEALTILYKSLRSGTSNVIALLFLGQTRTNPDGSRSI